MTERANATSLSLKVFLIDNKLRKESIHRKMGKPISLNEVRPPRSIRSLNRNRVSGHDDLAANLPSGYDVLCSRLSRCNIRIRVAIVQTSTLYRELAINKNVDGGGRRIMPWLQDN
jgi:hypothetical protein